MSNMYTVQEQPIAKKFLSAIGRNSKSSEGSYAVALSHFQNLLDTKKHTLSSIVKALTTNKINVYDLLDDFVTYILKTKNSNDSNGKISFKSIKAYMTAVKSFLVYNDIDIVPAKFKNKVKMPKVYREDEESVDASDIREIVIHTNSRRLKPFELLLASGGMRTIEGCSLRLCDVDLRVNPTRIDIRKEFTKTKQARYTFISDEATKFLKEWIDWKYRERRTALARKVTPTQKETDLIFGSHQETTPESIYEKMRLEFNKVLTAIKKDKRKEGAQRRKITLNSLRRFAKTTVSDQVSTDFSEWFIGHSKSSYWTKKPFEKAEIYKTKCMKYLTFLDYTIFEASAKGIQSQLAEKDKELQAVKNQLADLSRKLYEAGILKKD